MEIESELELQVAFYLLESSNKVAQQWYSKESKYVVELEREKEYVIRYFIRDSQKEVLIRDTQKIRIDS